MNDQGQTEIPNKVTGIRRTAIFLGIVPAVLGVPWAFLSCMAQFQSDLNLAIAYVGISSILRWIVVVVAFIRPTVGGSLLIIDGVILAWFSWDTEGLPSLLLSLILVASGVLFILSWILEQFHLQTRDD